MGIDTSPHQPFSVGSLVSRDVMSVRAAADEGRTRLGLLERIVDCVSDWVFNTDRAECKQCLLTFGSTKSTDLEKLQAFLKLESLVGADYKNRFTTDRNNEISVTLSIEVDLPDFPRFSVDLNRAQVLKDQMSAWAPLLGSNDVSSLIEKLYSEQTTVDEKYLAYTILRSNAGEEFKHLFQEELSFEESTYLYAIDFGLEPFADDFLAHGEVLSPLTAGPCTTFKENLIDIALAPMAAGRHGPEKQFQLDIDRGIYLINGVKFEGQTGDEGPTGLASVTLFNQQLKDQNFTEDEILMVRKLCHQSTPRAFLERAIDGASILTNQAGKFSVSYAVSKTDKNFSIEINCQSLLPKGKSLSELATAIQRPIEVGTILVSEPGTPQDEKDGKGWNHVSNGREIVYSDHTTFSITLNFVDIKKAPEVLIKSEMGTYSGPSLPL